MLNIVAGCLTAFGFGMLSLQAESNAWPQFRGPTGQGISSAKDLPIKWSPTENIAWKKEIPGQGWSSPVLSQGKVILTTADSEPNISLQVLALKSDDGGALWKTEVFKPEDGSAKAIHKKNSLASPTPIIDEHKVYVHFGHLGTAALDVNSGKILWKQTELKYSPVHGNGGSPALVGDRLVINYDGGSDPFIAALEAKSGKVLWRRPRNTPAKKTFSFSTPLPLEVDGAMQVISCSSGFVAGYDPANGKEIWRVRYGEGYSVVPRPIFANGLLFVSSGFDRPVIYAIDPKGAAGDVTETNVKWTLAKGAPTTPSLIAHEDELFFVSDAGVASCVEQKTGKVHWTERLGGGVSSSPILAEDRLYFQNEAGVTTVLKAGRVFEQLAKNDLKERALASFAAADGRLFVRTEQHLWCIKK